MRTCNFWKMQRNSDGRFEEWWRHRDEWVTWHEYSITVSGSLNRWYVIYNHPIGNIKGTRKLHWSIDGLNFWTILVHHEPLALVISQSITPGGSIRDLLTDPQNVKWSFFTILKSHFKPTKKVQNMNFETNKSDSPRCWSHTVDGNQKSGEKTWWGNGSKHPMGFTGF